MLVGGALHWTRIIRTLNANAANELDTTLTNAHFLVLALDHLDESLRWLENTRWVSARPERDEFRAAWAPQAELRNAFEHEEEYLAGYGKRRNELLDEESLIEPDGSWSAGLALGPAGILGVAFLGKAYSVALSIRKALALEPLLAAWQHDLDATLNHR